MPSYNISVVLRGGTTGDRYNITAETPAKAARAAADKWEAGIKKRLDHKGNTPRERQDLERVRVPALIEVFGSDGRIVGKFDVKEI